MSPDGRRVLLDVQETAEETLVWMIDLERDARTPISQRGCFSDSGAWSSDGKTVYFDSDRDPQRPWVVYKRSADGGGQPELVGGPDGALETAVVQCSGDGRWLLVYSILTDSNNDLFLGRLDANGQVTEWINWSNTPDAKEVQAAMSPDGRFVVYTSDVSGQTEVYLAPVQGGPTSQRWQVSTHGGAEPRFSPDGRAIYYREPSDRFVRVPVKPAGDGITLGVPVPGFEAREPDVSYYRNSFDTFPDGSLLVVRPVDDTGAAVDIDTNWWPAER